MFSDLAVSALLGALMLLVVAGVIWWVARSILAGALPMGGKLALRPAHARTSPEALLAANRAAAPFMQRYAMLVGGFALLAMLLTFVSDVAAVVVHLLAVVLLALGVWVCWRKASGQTP